MWTRVEDKLPENCDRVLVALIERCVINDVPHEEYHTVVGRYYERGHTWEWECGSITGILKKNPTDKGVYYEEITHWMPFPNPPERK